MKKLLLSSYCFGRWIGGDGYHRCKPLTDRHRGPTATLPRRPRILRPRRPPVLRPGSRRTTSPSSRWTAPRRPNSRAPKSPIVPVRLTGSRTTIRRCLTSLSTAKPPRPRRCSPAASATIRMARAVPENAAVSWAHLRVHRPATAWTSRTAPARPPIRARATPGLMAGFAKNMTDEEIKAGRHLLLRRFKATPWIKVVEG